MPSTTKPAKKARAAQTPRPRRKKSAPPAPPTTAPVPTPPPTTAQGVLVTLRTDRNYAVSFSSEKLQHLAMKWRAIVRNRRLWTSNQEKREEQQKHALKAMVDALKTSYSEEEVEHAIRQLAKASIIEVSVPYVSETIGWEARILPWEYLITAATKDKRQGRSLTIIRHLDCQMPAHSHPPENLLVVESTPGRVREAYNFQAEGAMVQTTFKIASNTKAPLGIKPHRSINEQATELRERIRTTRPDIIHLVGMDTHQGFNLGLWQPPAGNKVMDGYLMRDDQMQVRAVEAEELGTLLNAAPTRKPQLVSCNIYYSAARLCALAVAGGAETALGFQDEFDESLAEIFFSNFYYAWRKSDWDMLVAFVIACNILREQPRGLSGTGVVLWSKRSLLGTAGELLLGHVEKTQQAMREEKGQVIKPEQVSDETAARHLLPVEVKPRDTINYSMLHNERPLFERFLIHKLDMRRVNRVEVDVKLQIGDQAATYSASWDVVDPPLDLHDRIRLPLLSAPWAAIGESARSTLSISVKWGAHELYRQTHPVTLLTLDEWCDDDVNTALLPSFVLPRNPAVRMLIEAAQRYLMALRDDPSAGFDGYQSLNLEETDPEQAAEDVDAQVQAIWSAIVYDYNIRYTNPPPTFTNRSQRLRSPSEIFEANRGTCIDTTLLLAACLELVEIYPVLFLLTGHAFVGYWRSDQYRDEFFNQLAETNGSLQTMGEGEAFEFEKDVKASGPFQQTHAWYFEKHFYNLVLQQIRSGKLVPVESTLLAMRGSFGDAIKQGFDNLRNRGEFHSMLDVRSARENRVTPIPMRER